jgi:uncharacterized membrane-anchored protein YhcB (DUF1043 family)
MRLTKPRRILKLKHHLKGSFRMIYALFFLSGSLLGFGLALAFSKHTKPFRELQAKLASKEAQLHEYQDRVAQHFEKTAGLFAELQARQDRLVLHLQEGARDLRKGMIPVDDNIAIERCEFEVD